MATERRYYLNDEHVEPPENAPETSIKFNFEKDAFNENGTPKLALSITDFNFVRGNADTILQHFEDGKSLRGIPFRYEITRGTTNEKAFDGYLDLSANAKLSKLSCVVTAKQRQNIDWLNDTANSISFRYLESIGIITPDDYDFMPYVLTKIPDYQETAIAILSSFYLTDKLTEVITQLVFLATDASNPLTTVNGVIKFVVYIVYLLGLLIAIVLLIKKIILYLIQPVKYHACMKVKTILEKMALYFGFTFKSDTLNKAPFDRLYFMPEKVYNPLDEEKGILGYVKPQPILQRGYPSGNCGDFLRDFKQAFRQKIVINESKQLELVPEYQNTGSPQYQMGAFFQPEFGMNLDELVSNYELYFQTDSQDRNTMQEYLGTGFQAITKFVTAPPEGLSLLKKAQSEQINFALAKRKTDLTIPEDIIKGMLDGVTILINGITIAANAVIQAINVIIETVNKLVKFLGNIGIDIPFNVPTIPTIPAVNLGASIENRNGMMKLETDLFTVRKLFLMDKSVSDGDNPSKFNKISSDNGTVLSARYLYENFHKPVVSFLPSAGRPNGNQYIIKQFDGIPLIFDDFLKIKNNNNIFAADGSSAIIDDGSWNPRDETANLRVRISRLYIPDTEIEEIYLEPDGK